MLSVAAGFVLSPRWTEPLSIEGSAQADPSLFSGRPARLKLASQKVDTTRMRAHVEHPYEHERAADQRRLEWEQRMRRESLELSFAYVALGAVGVFAAVELVLYLVHG
jgi:hypothetical protein